MNIKSTSMIDQPLLDPVQLRLLGHEEIQPVLDVFHGMSQRSRFLRFMTPMPRLPGSILRALVDVDQDKHVAMVAMVDDRTVGLGRYMMTGRKRAEVGLAVIDEYQARGIGRTLLDGLVAYGTIRGMEAFTFSTHFENRAALKLIRAAGATVTFEDGMAQGQLSLSPRPQPAPHATNG
ncbi:N-acetyltransferase family protein [Streptosporangium sp. OZ121]|uniref:GNAT family N-acetyltransferase n=1 Tax=Streptosporangium sp. OZ121 TaxID=3444183 RepID=UPI003F7AAA05